MSSFLLTQLVPQTNPQPPHQGGFTVILIPRTTGVATKPIKTSYSPSAGTAYVTFDNVHVPVENTLGEEDAGLYVLLSNFNHERWVMCCSSARAQRLIVEECLKCVCRKDCGAFGLTDLCLGVGGLVNERRLESDLLISRSLDTSKCLSHLVFDFEVLIELYRLAAMIARTESVQNWLENVTHQMCCMPYRVQADRLAG
jgi:hypothetical protein